MFGQSKAEKVAAEYGIPVVAKLPIDPQITKLADAGRIEDYQTSALCEIFNEIEKAERTI